METLTMHDSQRIPDAHTKRHWRVRLAKIVVSSVLVLFAMSLGWLGFQLFMASVV